jgi:arylformamidase
MMNFIRLFIAFSFAPAAAAENVHRNIPYALPANERQMLDVYAPENAKSLPVVFWIHGGGWQVGDKTSVQAKPISTKRRHGNHRT